MDLPKTTDELAKELTEVQPTSPTLFGELLSAALNEEELIKAGYEPVSEHRFVWIKKNK